MANFMAELYQIYAITIAHFSIVALANPQISATS
jgi:hypothetical protein